MTGFYMEHNTGLTGFYMKHNTGLKWANIIQTL